MVVVPIANTWGFVVLQNESPWMPCAMVNTLKLCWCLSVPNVSFIFWRSLKAGVPWGFLYFVFVCPIDVTFLQLAVPRVDVTFAQLMWFLNPLLLGTISYVSIALLGTVPPTDQWFHVFRLFAIPTMVILECPLGVAPQADTFLLDHPGRCCTRVSSTKWCISAKTSGINLQKRCPNMGDGTLRCQIPRRQGNPQKNGRRKRLGVRFVN